MLSYERVFTSYHLIMSLFRYSDSDSDYCQLLENLSSDESVGSAFKSPTSKPLAKRKAVAVNEVSDLMLVEAPNSSKNPHDTALYACFDISPLPDGKNKVRHKNCPGYV